MCHGENTEQLLQSLSNVPYSAFYRKMKLDTLGNATEEYILDFDKKIYHILMVFMLKI